MDEVTMHGRLVDAQTGLVTGYVMEENGRYLGAMVIGVYETEEAAASGVLNARINLEQASMEVAAELAAEVLAEDQGDESGE